MINDTIYSKQDDAIAALEDDVFDLEEDNAELKIEITRLELILVSYNICIECGLHKEYCEC